MLEVLRNRRSVRKFKDIPIFPDIGEMLKEAVVRSPSSRGLNPWRVLAVVGVGYPDEQLQGNPVSALSFDQIIPIK